MRKQISPRVELLAQMSASIMVGYIDSDGTPLLKRRWSVEDAVAILALVEEKCVE